MNNKIQTKTLKTKRFSTGITDIDAQHEQLYHTVEIFNYENNSKEFLWQVLLDLEKYTAIHFSTEEKYMEKFDYPQKKEHIKEHRFFSEKFLVIKNDFAQEGFSEDFINSFREFLTTWLSEHYAGSDIQLAEFINERLAAISQEN